MSKIEKLSSDHLQNCIELSSILFYFTFFFGVQGLQKKNSNKKGKIIYKQ